MENKGKENVEFYFIMVIRGIIILLGLGVFIYDKVLGQVNPPLSISIYGVMIAIGLVGKNAIELIHKKIK